MTVGPAPVEAASVGEIATLYELYATDAYDERVSQLDHAVQTAALARSEGASDELIAAALLHDVGHLFHLAAHDGRWVPAEEDLGHESIGARYLSGVFGPGVTSPIALHVAAKRYRCSVDPTYHATLSAGSVRSLELQGGPMAPDEVAEFAAAPGSDDAVRLRGWDDAGKVDGLDVVPFEAYRPLLDRLARG